VTGAEILSVLMVVAVCGLLMAGYPVALTLGGVSLAFAVIGHLTGIMTMALLGALPQRIFGVMTNEVLLAIPLFVFMGVMLERSRIAEDLLETMGRLFGTLRGGLGISVVIVGTLLAAAKGVVGATTVTLGLIVLPTMLRHAYDPRLAAGAVAATATLAQIFPPAIVLVLLGDQISNAYQSAQLAQGNFAPNSVSVADLFAGAIVPAFALVALYIVYLAATAIVRPERAPALPPDPKAPRGFAMARRLGEVLVAPVALILAVLGSILGGLATPTEAAGVGAVGAILLAARRIERRQTWPIDTAIVALLGALLLRQGGLTAMAPLLTVAAFGIAVALWRLFHDGALAEVAARTTQFTSMIFLILIGATMFSLVFRGLGGDDLVHRALSELPGGAAAAIVVVMLAMFLLGFIMDAFEIIFVVVPIVAPVLLRMPGVDPVWLGVLMAVNLQTSYLTPPFGPTLFFLRGVAPPEITTRHLYAGAVPFVAIQLGLLLILWFVPGLATALPNALYAR
jgi:tripartite ATP-independent transporter DctM subunit